MINFNIQAKGLNLSTSPQGEARIRFDGKDINVQLDNQSTYKIDAIIDGSSIEWVRYDSVLLIPRVRLKLRVANPSAKLVINYKEQSFNFQQSKKYGYAELFYSLFEREDVSIYDGNKRIATVRIKFYSHDKNKAVIDYTCSRNSIEVTGLEDEHFSIGCHTRRIGNYGKEKPMLEVKWISPELEIVGSKSVPYNAAFLNRFPIKVKVRNVYTDQFRELTIKAKIPKRLHRLFTAYGFGPYTLNTKTLDSNEEEIEKKDVQIAPALFFYLNYKISETTSVRGFDAAIFQESRFNNAGIYLGSDFGYSLDNKLYFTTLLGVQYLYFKFDDDAAEISEPIFPQGIEFMYRHAFDIPNYIISGGIFLSTSESIDYENVWIRWGKSYFWELNLITWGKDDFEARTWGLSVGFPFKGFL